MCTGLTQLYNSGFTYCNRTVYNYLRFKKRNKIENKILNILEKDFYGIRVIDEKIIIENFNYYNPPCPNYFYKWIKSHLFKILEG